MNAEQVVEKILSDARAQADKILGQAHAQLQTEQAKMKEQLDNYKKQTLVLAEKGASEARLRLLASARMEIAKENLAEKRRILDEVFRDAQKRLAELPDEDYRHLMAELIIKAAETGDEEVIIDKNEKRINEDFIKQVNQKLGTRGNLKLSLERRNLGAGFVLKRGKIKTNISAEVLINEAREALETQIAEELFS